MCQTPLAFAPLKGASEIPNFEISGRVRVSQCRWQLSSELGVRLFRPPWIIRQRPTEPLGDSFFFSSP